MRTRPGCGELADEVRGAGGVIRQPALAARGFGKYAIAQAVTDGVLVRIRRSWLALPDADPYLVAAARAGVVLTCTTQAQRLGLWVLAAEVPHVAAPAHAGAVRLGGADRLPGAGAVGAAQTSAAVVHWAKPLVPRHPSALVDPVENTLCLVAQCQPFETALAIWESALRRGIADAVVLARLALPGSARRILDAASPFSDSGLETFVVPRLRWMKIRIIPQAWLHGRPVDFLIGDRLVLQVDGGHHVGAQRERDIAHDAQLLLRGYHVIRVGYAQVVHDWPAVQDVIMRAVAQGLHRTA